MGVGLRKMGLSPIDFSKTWSDSRDRNEWQGKEKERSDGVKNSN